MTRVKAMILAAGRGERLLPLTASIPKPLLEVGGETLIERHVTRLVAAGIRALVINVSHLADRIVARLGDGGTYGASIEYSHEPGAPLETAGGIVAALPLLGTDPFVVVNADIWTDFPFAALPRAATRAHLVLVPNPPHNPGGDFALDGTVVTRHTGHRATYAGIGVYTPAFFAGCAPGRRPLAPLLFAGAERGELTGQLWCGRWFDIGTAERLATARRALGGPPAARA